MCPRPLCLLTLVPVSRHQSRLDDPESVFSEAIRITTLERNQREGRIRETQGRENRFLRFLILTHRRENLFSEDTGKRLALGGACLHLALQLGGLGPAHRDTVHPGDRSPSLGGAGVLLISFFKRQRAPQAGANRATSSSCGSLGAGQ